MRVVSAVVLTLSAIGHVFNAAAPVAASPLQQTCTIFSWARAWQEFDHEMYPQVSGAASFVEWSSLYDPLVPEDHTSDLHIELYNDYVRFRAGLMMYINEETEQLEKAFFTECWGSHCGSPVKRVLPYEWSFDTPYQVQMHVHSTSTSAYGDAAIFDSSSQLLFWTKTTVSGLSGAWNSDQFLVGGLARPAFQGVEQTHSTIGHGWLGQPRFVWCDSCPTWEPVTLLDPDWVTAPPSTWAEQCGVHIEVGTDEACDGADADCYH